MRLDFSNPDPTSVWQSLGTPLSRLLSQQPGIILAQHEVYKSYATLHRQIWTIFSRVLVGDYSDYSLHASNANLATVARLIELDQHLTLHPGHVGAVSPYTLATGLEAVFGAIYQDCGGDMSIVSAAMTAVGIELPGTDDN